MRRLGGWGMGLGEGGLVVLEGLGDVCWCVLVF
jgi:hypothetical protein